MPPPRRPPDPLASAAELLDLLDEFLQTASPDLEDDLRTFLIEKGWHPQHGYESFADLVTQTAVKLRQHTSQ